MNGADNHSDNRQGQGNDTLSELFRLASPRQRPPVEDEQFVRKALRKQWRDITRNKRRRRTMWPWAIAASLVLVSLAGIGLKRSFGPVKPPQTVAIAHKLIGQAMVQTPAGSTSLQDIPKQELAVGQSIIMGPESGAALAWANGAVVRLDEDTELNLDSRTEILLVSGRIYLDTATADPSGPPVTIRTPQGVVQHLGTQFMTQVSAAGTAISVREGKVAYFPSPGHEDERMYAGKGQQLAVSADGMVDIQPIRTWGAEWEWAEGLAAGFTAGGRNLSDLLAWAGRESGRQVVYKSAGAEAMAASTELRGDLDLKPMQAVWVISATSDLVAEVQDGLIVVYLPSVK